ncbi:MBL fold metallo-hydrolase [Bacillus marinisedimentorum]|uniref:MBL fold metallo-hydrolase n=1 Tax=Bacillus marinisedimentorum TaxID=1821260 RepID=UPI0008733820|nr:MBL fold metallo-hydrolase [Bacillus marinisedimentorum]
MEMIQISERCFYFNGAVNIGYMTDGESGLMIDAGLDKSAAKKVKRKLGEKGMPLTDLFITHAHADHYGGAQELVKGGGVTVYAPALEEAVLRYPILEPYYLFQGNEPPAELRNKFLEGPPLTADAVVEEGECRIGPFAVELVELGGHSMYQLGLLADGVLFAADGYFGTDQLAKHKIPYLIDAGKTIASLNKLLGMECDGAVPGHGQFEKEWQKTVQANLDYHEKVLASMVSLLENEGGLLSQEDLVRLMCKTWNVHLNNLGSWALYRTAVTAYAEALIARSKAEFVVHDYKMCVKLK